MKIYKDYNQVYDVNIWDLDNYGYVRDTWPAGNYQVFVKGYWQTNDVRDYAFRTFMPSAAKFKITQVENTSGAAQDIRDKINLLKSQKSPCTLVNNKGYKYKQNWFGSNSEAFEFGFQGVSGQTCTAQYSMYVYNGSARLLNDLPSGSCTQTTDSKGTNIYTCTCVTNGVQQCNELYYFQLASGQTSPKIGTLQQDVKCV